MLERAALGNMTDDELLRYVDRSRPDVAELAERLQTAIDELKGYEAWARNVNQALNEGDGAYRP